MIRDLTAIIDRKRQEAGERTFGILEARRQTACRHGYLLALEEVERAAGELHATQTTPVPRDAA